MRLLAFVLVAAAFFVLALIAWGALVVKTGGALSECDRGDCGTLGEFTFDYPFVLLGAIGLALALSWAVVGRLR